ncbi:hypothetical protein C8F04DRAFT_1357607 [Mycena alexandri]|uniref:Uncharacterized protein n=1 Tax=Mycena alexandri TaxID=1745969 RepID=A0AAD6X2N9_9AGAR|nr:hypothetical protein C8F04DRAFT_1357607 [Mycena alexandri]
MPPAPIAPAAATWPARPAKRHVAAPFASFHHLAVPLATLVPACTPQPVESPCPRCGPSPTPLSRADTKRASQVQVVPQTEVIPPAACLPQSPRHFPMPPLLLVRAAFPETFDLRLHRPSLFPPHWQSPTPLPLVSFRPLSPYTAPHRWKRMDEIAGSGKTRCVTLTPPTTFRLRPFSSPIPCFVDIQVDDALRHPSAATIFKFCTNFNIVPEIPSPLRALLV